MADHGAIWHGEPLRTAVASGDLGAIVRCLRKASNLTLAELATRCGYSASTLSRLETGKQPLRDVVVLRSIARALGVPPNVLGLADTPGQSGRAGRGAASVGSVLASDEEIDPMRRRTLLAGLTGFAGSAFVGTLEHALLNPPAAAGSAVGLPQLRHSVSVAYSVFQHGCYTEAAAMLPDLLSTVEATRAEQIDGADINAANAYLADIYTLASELMIKLAQDDLAWTTADRAMQAAHVSGDILTQATARRAWCIVLRRAGRADVAQRLIVDTASALQSELRRGPEHLSVYGSLLATAAYTAAVDGDRDTATTLIGEAVDTADRLGSDGNHRFTTFGPTRVTAYQISIARVLGDYGTAIEHARHINPTAIPFAERRARYWTDVARSYHEWNKPEQCFRALRAAEHASAEEVRYRKPIQQITTSLLHHPTANALPGLRAFARRNVTLT